MDPPAAVLPLSRPAALTLQRVRQAIRDPQVRSLALAGGDLTIPVAQALQVLDDPDFRAAAADIRALEGHPPAPGAPRPLAVRTRRRVVLQILDRRYPQAFSALHRNSPGPCSIVTSPYFFVHMVSGPTAGRALEDLFPLDPLDSTGR